MRVSAIEPFIIDAWLKDAIADSTDRIITGTNECKQKEAARAARSGSPFHGFSRCGSDSRFQQGPGISAAIPPESMR